MSNEYKFELKVGGSSNCTTANKRLVMNLQYYRSDFTLTNWI